MSDFEVCPVGTLARLAEAEALLREIQSAAWDVCDVVQTAIDDPEDANITAMQAALDAIGELIPAKRPTDSAPGGQK